MQSTRLEKGEGVQALSLKIVEALSRKERWRDSSTGFPSAHPEVALLCRIRQCDEKAFLEAYDRYHASIYQFVWQMSGDAAAAADITQEVFLRMLEGGQMSGFFSRFDPRKGSLEAYLLGVARRLTRKLQVRESRWVSLNEDLNEDWRQEPNSASGSTPGEEIESKFTISRLRASIAGLPVKYREAIVLCCLQERSYEQAAMILGCSTGTVSSRLSRARRLLAERW